MVIDNVRVSQRLQKKSNDTAEEENVENVEIEVDDDTEEVETENVEIEATFNMPFLVPPNHDYTIIRRRLVRLIR